MNFFQEQMKAKGYEIKTSSNKTPRDKAKYQAEVMLEKLTKIKSVNALNYDGSAPTWWAGKPTAAGKRGVQVYYGGKRVEGTYTEVENTVEAVTQYVADAYELLDKAPEEFYEAEEKRRAETTPRTRKSVSNDPK